LDRQPPFGGNCCLNRLTATTEEPFPRQAFSGAPLGNEAFRLFHRLGEGLKLRRWRSGVAQCPRGRLALGLLCRLEKTPQPPRPTPTTPQLSLRSQTKTTTNNPKKQKKPTTPPKPHTPNQKTPPNPPNCTITVLDNVWRQLGKTIQGVELPSISFIFHMAGTPARPLKSLLPRNCAQSILAPSFPNGISPTRSVFLGGLNHR